MPTFVNPESVQGYRNLISNRVAILDAEIAKCGKKLPEATAASFAAWRSGWEVVKKQDNGFWVAKSNTNQLDVWNEESKEWQTKIIALCNIDAPQFDPSPAETTVVGAVSSVSGLVKWGLLAFVVVKAWPLVSGAIDSRKAKSGAK